MKDYFATSFLLIWGKSKHNNHYGSLEMLIQKELTDNESLCQSLLPLNVEITKFELSSEDKCYKNIATVTLEIQTNDKTGIWGDHYNQFSITINIYSDLVPVVIHEAGHAKDFSMRKRKKGNEIDYSRLFRISFI